MVALVKKKNAYIFDRNLFVKIVRWKNGQTVTEFFLRIDMEVVFCQYLLSKK